MKDSVAKLPIVSGNEGRGVAKLPIVSGNEGVYSMVAKLPIVRQ